MIIVALLTSLLVSSIRVELGEAADGTVYIRADGTIDPPDAPISTFDNVTYTLTDNITSDADGIVIERDNMTLDGAGYMVQGMGSGNGINLTSRSNVTIRNMQIEAFNGYGIYIGYSSNNSITNNTADSNGYGIYVWSSSYNNLVNNTANSNGYGILLQSSSSINILKGNTIDSNVVAGIYLSSGSSRNILTNNMAKENGMYDIQVWANEISVCNNMIENNTGSGNRPIKFFNSSVTLQDEILSELILCNADNSYIDNVTILGSEGLGNNGILIWQTTNSNFTNIDSSSNYIGIYIYSSSNNTISENSATANGVAGICLVYSSNNNAIIGNNATANSIYGIWLDSSSNNTISGNIATANGQDGICLSYSSNSNTIGGNNIANNEYGIKLVESSNNRLYHNNFINNTVHVYIYPSYSSVWDNGYPSGGNYWSDYNGVDLCRGQYQNETGSDGIGDTPYVIDAINQDRFPLVNPYGSPPLLTHALMITATADGTTNPIPGTYTYSEEQIVPVQAIPNTGYVLGHWELDGTNVGSANPYLVPMDANHTLHAAFRMPFHDVAVTNVTPSKTVVGHGFSMNINVTAANQGDFTETSNVTVYANTTIILQTEVTLTSGTSTTITFTWNTSDLAKGNYTISAYAWSVPNETYTTDNNCTDGTVKVGIPGDVDPVDGYVGIDDIFSIASHFGQDPSSPTWNPNCDVNGDEYVGIDDIFIAASHFGQEENP